MTNFDILVGVVCGFSGFRGTFCDGGGQFFQGVQTSCQGMLVTHNFTISIWMKISENEQKKAK